MRAQWRDLKKQQTVPRLRLEELQNQAALLLGLGFGRIGVQTATAVVIAVAIAKRTAPQLPLLFFRPTADGTSSASSGFMRSSISPSAPPHHTTSTEP